MNYQTPESKGRYGDTTLVHMNPQEVAGLNALGAAYGRPLTINPSTGYPEAFNLRNLLPMIIGTGLNIATGGALTPLQAGMITGAGYGVVTGDPMKAISAGFGAAGGAGLGEGLTAAGATTMPAQGASTMAENFARAGEGFKALGSSEGLNAFMGTSGTSAVPATGVGGVAGLAKSTAMSMAPQMTDIPEYKAPEQVSYIRPYSLDIENVSDRPYTSSAEQQQLTYRFKEEEPYRVAQGGHIKYQEGGEVSAPVADVYRSIANVQQMAGLPVIDVPSAMPRPTPPMMPATPPAQMYTPTNYGITLPSPEESPIYTAMRQPKPSTGFKFGGGGSDNSDIVGYTSTGQPVYGSLSSVPNSVFGGFDAGGAAEGGLASMREGRFLRGDGDGMSDEIPASIEGEVDALLSDGEFVIPADVVSHLGNGSSEAGARVLYEMMDRIRHERTGKKEQAKEVPVEKVMPV